MNLAELGMLLAMLSVKADAGDQEAAAMRDKLIAGLGDQVDAALAAAKADGAGPDSSDDITASMSEEEKASYAAMSEPMKAMYKAGVKAMKTESENKDKVAAEEKIEAEKDKEEKVAATISAEQLLMMADGELAKAMAPRQKIVAELVQNGLVKRGGDTEKQLLSPSYPDAEFTKFVAARKSTTVVIPSKAIPPAEAPSTKGKGLTVQAEQKIGKLAGAFGVSAEDIKKKLQAR